MSDFFIQVGATLTSTFILFLLSKLKNVNKQVSKRIRRIILILALFFVATYGFVDTLKTILNLNFGVYYISNIVLLMMWFFNIVSSVLFIYRELPQK